jgi:hypothetical protein
MGEIKSGTLLGHTFPAFFFVGFGVYFLLLNLRRVNTLRPGQSFCDVYVPERDPNVLRYTGFVLTFVTVFGAFWEGMGGFIKFGKFFFQLLHETIYFCFGFVGVVSYLESKELLPPDSFRVSMVIALLLFSLMMRPHAAMKPGPVDAAMHALLANLCLAFAAIGTYSICHPKSPAAFVLAQVMLIVMGVWLQTIGLYIHGVEIPLHWVETVFVLETLVILLVIVFIAAIALPPRNEHDRLQSHGGDKKGEYSHLVLDIEDSTESGSIEESNDEPVL